MKYGIYRIRITNAEQELYMLWVFENNGPVDGYEKIAEASTKKNAFRMVSDFCVESKYISL